MGVVIAGLAALLAGLAALALVLGAHAWWQVRHSRVFWVVLRCAQGAAALLAAGAGLAAALGHPPDDDLFWVYALVPVAVSFVAEQFRALSATAVLDQRGIENARALGDRSDAEQRSVVVAILRRETGVMTVAAGVLAFMALRALGTAAGL